MSFSCAASASPPAVWAWRTQMIGPIGTSDSCGPKRDENANAVGVQRPDGGFRVVEPEDTVAPAFGSVGLGEWLGHPAKSRHGSGHWAIAARTVLCRPAARSPKSSAGNSVGAGWSNNGGGKKCFRGAPLGRSRSKPDYSPGGLRHDAVERRGLQERGFFGGNGVYVGAGFLLGVVQRSVHVLRRRLPACTSWRRPRRSAFEGEQRAGARPREPNGIPVAYRRRSGNLLSTHVER